MAVVRWEPFRELAALQGEMGRCMAQMSGTTPGTAQSRRGFRPSTCGRRSDELVLAFELPGVDGGQGRDRDRRGRAHRERRAGADRRVLERAVLPLRAPRTARSTECHASVQGVEPGQGQGRVRRRRARGPRPEAGGGEAEAHQHRRAGHDRGRVRARGIAARSDSRIGRRGITSSPDAAPVGAGLAPPEEADVTRCLVSRSAPWGRGLPRPKRLT